MIETLEKRAVKIKPLGERILVRPIEQEKVSKGGLIIPQTVKLKAPLGEVVDIGPGRLGDGGSRSIMEVCVGDMILFSPRQNCSHEVNVDDEKYVITDQESIFGCLRAGKTGKEEFSEERKSNTYNYPEVITDNFVPFRDYVYVLWEESNHELLGGKLVRPETHRGQAYTGVVLQIGQDVKHLKPGNRFLFDRFGESEDRNHFLKFFDPKYGRIAMLKEQLLMSGQWEPFTLLPPRGEDSKIETPHEGGFNYDL